MGSFAHPSDRGLTSREGKASGSPWGGDRTCLLGRFMPAKHIHRTSVVPASAKSPAHGRGWRWPGRFAAVNRLGVLCTGLFGGRRLELEGLNNLLKHVEQAANTRDGSLASHQREHCALDEVDSRADVWFSETNPVNREYVIRAVDWPFSSA